MLKESRPERKLSQIDKNAYMLYNAVMDDPTSKHSFTTDRYKIVAELLGNWHWRSVYRLVARAIKAKYSPTKQDFMEYSESVNIVKEYMDGYIERKWAKEK